MLITQPIYVVKIVELVSKYKVSCISAITGRDMGWREKIFGPNQYDVELRQSEFLSDALIEWNGASYVLQLSFVETVGDGNDIAGYRGIEEETGQAFVQDTLLTGEEKTNIPYESRPNEYDLKFVFLDEDENICFSDRISIRKL